MAEVGRPWTSGSAGLVGAPCGPADLAFLFPPSSLHATSAGGRHMVSELLNRKSGCRSSQISFHVVSLIPGLGFRSVLQFQFYKATPL